MEVAHLYDLSTNYQAFSYLHELAEGASLSNYPFASLDHSPSATILPRKRRAISDLAEDNIRHFDESKPLHDDISLDVRSLPPLINGDRVQDLATMADHDKDALNQPLITASHKCSEFEDVLNLLWMEDDTASATHSGSSALANSDQISLISDLDWDYGVIESSSSNQGDSQAPSLHSFEPNKQGLLSRSSGIVQDDFVYSWDDSQEEQAYGYDAICSRRLQKTEARKNQVGEVRPSWPYDMRSSWQREIRASWQNIGSRNSWQVKQEEGYRACWQPKPGKEGRSRPMAGGGFKEGQRVQEGGVAAPTVMQPQPRGPGPSLKWSAGSGAWAGPTLLDIESALALNGCDSPNSTGTLSSLSPLSSPSSAPKHSISTFFDIKNLLISDDSTKSTGNPDILDSSWRLKLQKRNNLEPKYTVRVESEEKALGDGYRWRKYGQKTIKNSPFPRSYYRCSSGKCNAKKQVEQCHEDGGLFLITYEGIHFHHKPNPLHKFHPLGDSQKEKKDKVSPQLSTPSLSISCSFSKPANFPVALTHPLLT